MKIFNRSVVFIFAAFFALVHATNATNLVEKINGVPPPSDSRPPGFDSPAETVKPSPPPVQPAPISSPVQAISTPPLAQPAAVPAPVVEPARTVPPIIAPAPATAPVQKPVQAIPAPAIAPEKPPVVESYTPPLKPAAPAVPATTLSSDKPHRLAKDGEYTGTLRYWHADWTWDGENNVNELGSAPFFLMTLNYRETEYTISGQIGYGSGWAQDLTRLDLSLAVKWHEDAFSYGLGVRRMGYDSGYDEANWSYLGPEVYASYENFFEDSAWAYHLNLSAGYYVWSAEQNTIEADGNTFGYSGDAGLGYFFDKTILRAGYRMQVVAEDDPFPQDEFMGPYAEIELAF